MARPSNEQRLAAIHEAALVSFNRVQAASRDERKQCLDDRRFYSIPGAMWEGPLSQQYENRPKFEVNKTHMSVIRIFNEYRNNRITVDFVPRDGAKDDRLADVLDGLYRADEQDSCAEEAYDNAFEEGVGGGIGAWRLRACYEDEEDDDDDRQRIRIEPIYDADTCVYFNLDARRQDKSDAKECWVLSGITRDEYLEEWNDDPASWPKTVQDTQFDWNTPDLVYIAEYYKVVEKRETWITYQSLTGEEERYRKSELDDDPELVAALEAQGLVETRRKTTKVRRVHKYIMSGGGILEDCGIIAGKHIPIIPFYGKRWFVDGIERVMGQVRLAKDPQRLKNMQLSKLGEISALSSVEKPILIPEQIAGHTVMWAEDNVKNYPYLLINPMTGPDGAPMASGPLAYTKSPQIPPAMAALLQITEQDMAEILGSNQQAEEVVSNISGKAVELIQQRLDMQTFIYMSNFAKAVKRCGEVWLGMAQELYSEAGRKMKSVGAMGDTATVVLQEPRIDEETGETIYNNDLSDAKHDVVVDVGPSFTSRRDATVRALTGMMQITDDPTTKQVLQAMAMMNMDGEGINEVKDFFRKQLVQMGVVQPTEEEAMAMAEQEQQPDPNSVYLAAAAEEAQAKAAKARADTVLTLAQAEKARADTAKVEAEAAQIAAGEPPERPEMRPENPHEAVELEGKVLANVIKLRQIDREDAQTEAAKVEGTAIAKLADAAGAIKDAAVGLSEGVTGFQEAVEAMAANTKDAAKAQKDAAKAALDMLAKPKRVVREKGRIVGIE